MSTVQWESVQTLTAQSGQDCLALHGKKATMGLQSVRVTEHIDMPGNKH